MSFRKHCQKCYAYFMDSDIYDKHVAVCGYASDKKTAESEGAGDAEQSGEPEQPDNTEPDGDVMPPDGQAESEGVGDAEQSAPRRGRPPRFQAQA